MNVETGTETLIFLFWEYLFRNFGILSLQCVGQARVIIRNGAALRSVISARPIWSHKTGEIN
jgi:hypothetical protein